MATASPTVQVQGPHEESKPDHRQKLSLQLPLIPRDTDTLIIQNDTPSDTEWALLGLHFPLVRNLEIHTGYNEDLNDRHIPPHWPLSRLLISSASGTITQTPFIRQGRVSHLILDYTSGLRFEGPDNQELQDRHKEAIARGEAESEYITVHKGTPEERKIEIVFLPQLAMAWLDAKYGGPNFNELDPDNAPPTQHEVNLQTLEIVENDAMCTFARMTLALPHVVRNTSALHLSSTNGCCEFQQTNEKMFVQFLPQMENLRTLQLSVGEVFRDEAHLHALYRLFPRTLTTLRLRGPAMLTQSDRWKEWEEAFASRTFLPELKRLSIQMDLCYKDRESGSAGWPLKERTEIPEEIRRAADATCEQLGALARRRGVNVEEMEDWGRLRE
ncbi:uncharacterized protein BO66DRAFT_396429 [Aspergillus aculeatinus CBS 121060]|uniref:Uncharacterized protein n=1 Tax=Aspergillus aculeatinus CBS 121060 TaxID=1448322 RepID=A0ACD1GSI5_9EURO|nr:hypothetical protein BO66DRAFT_396429 [Aspergillus aculeatinus CBS 121060]RAH64158.1 hypothetical protein BO66DRAFT_396429 [Aspergillus aculeatinus CBS 121060]